MSRLTALIRAWKSRHLGLAEEAPPPPLQLPPVRAPQQRCADWSAIRNSAVPGYADLAASGVPARDVGSPPVFITARFRSGSTLLWNILRQLPELTAYYEPLHPTLERPPEERLRADDPTHVGVEDYWSEYDQIDGFSEHHTEPWYRHDLYLDASDWKPAMFEYLQLLIRSAPGRPVLQFNRADFRLTWLRRMFPDAKVVHLFRHPRDQWLSVLRDPSALGPSDTNDQFLTCDHFSLVDWVHELSARFPILDWDLVDHPYQMHYLVWKLSYLWGQASSHLSISYEQLITAPESTLSRLFKLLGLDTCRVPQLAGLIHPRPLGRWRTYAPDTWFTAHEQRAEQLLNTFLGPDTCATATLSKLERPARVA